MLPGDIRNKIDQIWDAFWSGDFGTRRYPALPVIFRGASLGSRTATCSWPRSRLPPITLQREFARRVTAVEALKMAQRASLAELDALFATLQHRAFRGEL